jgi:hypothetical protein
MAYRVIGDGVAVVHFGFIVFVAVGGILAWRWRQLIWPHLAAVTWGAGIVTIGWTCPLTPLENHFRRLGGESDDGGGFVDRYIEGVIYPDRYANLLRALVALLVLVGWSGYLRTRRTSRRRAPA